MSAKRAILHVGKAAARRALPLPARTPAKNSAASGQDYLRALGERVREARARRGMTRKILAKDSSVSERYLAQLESGEGNASILLLRQVTRALDMPLEAILPGGPEPPIEFTHTTEFLRRLQPDEIHRAHQLLLQHFSGVDAGTRRSRVALIGLRGAGKSTLGALLAERLDAPFIELDRVIEKTSGVSLSVIFDLYGQSGFRRLERQCLEEILERHPRFVLSTGGSLVSEHATFERLLGACFTVWLRATPEDHMQRVIAQGDIRPISEHREAMADLRRILSVRQPLYSEADLVIDTAGHTPAESLRDLLNALKSKPAERNGTTKSGE
jgi:XRE family transcriptional regulator, aerobic/anaerobic benzoate catabolism transcriptional regulator